MRQNKRLIIGVPITLTVIVILLLYKNNFFCDFKDSTFNNIVTPVATLIAAGIYFYTLMELKSQREVSISQGQKNWYFDRIDKIKNELKDEVIRIYDKYLNSKDDISKKKLYSTLYQIFDLIKSDPPYYTHLENEVPQSEIVHSKYYDILTKVKHSVIWPLSRHFEEISELVNQISASTMLTEADKEILVRKIRQDTLSDYLTIYDSEREEKVLTGDKFKEKVVDLLFKDFRFPGTTKGEDSFKITSILEYGNLDTLYKNLKEKRVI